MSVNITNSTSLDSDAKRLADGDEDGNGHQDDSDEDRDRMMPTMRRSASSMFADV